MWPWNLTRKSARDGFALAGLDTAVLLVLAVATLSVLRLLGEFEFMFLGGKALEIASTAIASPALRSAVTAYAAALVGVHLVLAALAFGVSRLAQYAFRRPVAERRKLAAVCFMLAYAWVHLANAALFPNSIFAGNLHSVLSEPVMLGVSLFGIVTIALAGTLALIVTMALRRARPVLARQPRAYPVLAALSLFGLVALLSGYREAPSTVVHTKPNVILIGIDSLRCDLSAFGPPGSLTPEVDRFLQQAQVFSDAITPLARTFPAWASILTGRHPVTTGARINLTARARIHEGDTLADILRSEGYRTVLATDEVRFSNIDESYGFDRLIAPPIGVTDFVLGTFNDFPLTNLLAQTRAAAWLFPNTYANRAAYKTYDPTTFVSRLEHELDNTSPMFLMLHLTLAHYPYAWDDLEYTGNITQFKQLYPKALSAVDRQFADLFAVLERKGLLDNAIVVLLSDHGEAVGLPDDSLLPKPSPDPGLRWSSLWGHGTSVLSPHQYRVVLGMRSFGNTLLNKTGAVHSMPVSLEDVAPTLLDLLGFASRGPFDGRSLAGFTDGNPATDPDWSERIRFTESEFNPPALFTDDEFDDVKLATSAGDNYLVTAEGRLELRDESVQRIIRAKELAVLEGARKLAAVPDGHGEHLYFWFDGVRSFPMRFTSPPDFREHPDAADLYAALASRFPGELPEPSQDIMSLPAKPGY